MPGWLRATIARAYELFSPAKLAAERDEELRFHIEQEIEHNRRLGMSDDEARRAALIAFGGYERFREEVHDARGFVMIDNLVRDTRFALRRIRRAPAFGAAVIATLGIGIGTAAGIGAIVYGVLLRDLPYKQSGSLVRVSLITPGIAVSGDLHSDASYVHLAASARSFDGFGAYYTNSTINLSDGESAERVTAAMVTPGTFHMLGVTPVLGQLFAPEDTAGGRTTPVLISEVLWERRYGRDPGIIGKTIEANRGPRIVIGVLPRAFDFPSPAVSIWYPLSVGLERPSLEERYFNVIARLKPGVTTQAAQAELNALLPALSARFPAITPDAIQRSAARISIQSLKSAIIAPVRSQLVLLGIMVGVVLLIATTNVVTLFLLRAERAASEIAIARSLGATRAAIARRFVAEGMVLGVASAAVALPVAAAAVATKLGFGQREIPRLHEVTFGVEVIVAVVATALAIGAALGLTALTRSGSGIERLGDRLRGATRATASLAWRRVQRGLVATQVAMALALLVAAGLLGRSFWNLRNATLGFEPASATVFEIALPYNGYASHAEAAAFHARVIDRLNALPGITGVAAATHLPLAGSAVPELTLRLEAVGGSSSGVVATRSGFATSDYFRVIGIPLRSGRPFAAGDLRGGAPAVILSESLARALFGTGDAVDRRIRRAPARGLGRMEFTVIGVAGDVHGERIEDGPASMVYFPLLRDGDGVPRDSFPLPIVPRGARYVVRGSIPPSPQTIRATLRELDARVPAAHIQPLAALVDSATARVRLTLSLMGIASGVALLLGIVGVYSVVSYAAAGRLREFGVRLALGATPGRVASLVLHEGAIVAAMGIAAGLGGALAGTQLLESLLYGVSPTSAPEFWAAAVLVVGVTLVATLIPARRASRTDPAVVLRGE